MRNRTFAIVLSLFVVALALGACGPAATTAPTSAPAPTTAPAAQPTATTAAPAPAATPTAAKKALKVGLVTDTGGVNDKSFNQSAWAGVQKAQKDFGADVKF